MRVTGLDHINIRTHDLERLKRFYIDVLGLADGDRPPFGAPGAWLYAGGHPVLHVSVASAEAQGGTLPVDHYALRAEGIADTLQRLDSAGVGYEIFDVPQRAIRQVFLSDPDGVTVELDFTDAADLAAQVSSSVDGSSRRRRRR